MLVQSQRQFFHWDPGVCVEVQREPQRMDTGIGAAAPLDVGAVPQYGFQCVLHRLRHAAAVGLHLKPAVVRAVVA